VFHFKTSDTYVCSAAYLKFLIWHAVIRVSCGAPLKYQSQGTLPMVEKQQGGLFVPGTPHVPGLYPGCQSRIS